MENGIVLRGKFGVKKKVLIGIVTIFAIGGMVANFLSEKAETPPEQMENLDLTKNENRFYLSDTEYKENMEKVVKPYIENYLIEGTFHGFQDISLHYKQYKNPAGKAKIVIQHGFTENAEKYEEVIYYFLKEGYSVYVMDLRGHGYSEREIDNSSKVYVKHFSDYVEDLKCFMEQIVTKEEGEKPCFLYAHSMGGGVGAYFLETYPKYFKAAILTAPMMEIECGDYPEKVAETIAAIMNATGKGKEYIWGQGPFSADYHFEKSSCGTEERYEYFFNLKKEYTEYQTNSGTFTWLKTCIDATQQMTSREYASKVECPVLLFQAENDKMVKRSGQYRFVKNTKQTQLVCVEDARHEIYTMESKIRIPYFNTIFEFLDNYSKPRI